MASKQPPRLIKKTIGSPRPKALDRKDLREISGSFAMGARRDEIIRKELKGKGVVARCSNCGAIYHDKHWQSASLVPAYVLKEVSASALCDECAKPVGIDGEKVTGYGGEVMLEVHDPQDKIEIAGLVRNVGKRAMARNPEHRIIRMKEYDGRIMIYTTENQLAVAIGKEVDSARKGGRLSIDWADGDKYVHVRWTVPE